MTGAVSPFDCWIAHTLVSEGETRLDRFATVVATSSAGFGTMETLRLLSIRLAWLIAFAARYRKSCRVVSLPSIRDTRSRARSLVVRLDRCAV